MTTQITDAQIVHRNILMRAYDACLAVLAGVASIWILLLMVAITADVLSALLLNAPIYGVVEITGQSVVAIVFFQLPYALQRGRITRADFLIGAVVEQRPALGAAMNMLFCFLGACVLAAIAARAIPSAIDAFQSGEYFGARSVFSAPIWPVFTCVVIGSVLMTIEFLIQTVAAARRIRGISGLETLFLVVGVAAVAGLAVYAGLADLSRPGIGAVALALVVVFILVGMHIPVAVMLCGVVAIWILRDNPTVALKSLQTAATGTVNSFAFGVVPLFVLMGLLLDRANIGRDAYKVAAWSLRRLPGGLGIATVAANAVFAAVTGISIASAAVFSRIAVPQMVKAGFSRSFAAGTVAGSSVLGMLIPPSLLLIIYGFVSETSVGKLFVAAIIPGIILALAFCVLIFGLALLAPKMVMDHEAEVVDIDPVSKLDAVKLLAPIVGLVVLILGGIYQGWFTPTQAGAIGAFIALIMTYARGAFKTADLWIVLKETAEISVIVLFLIISASVLTKMLAMSTIPTTLVGLVTDAEFGLWGFMLCYLAIVVLLGMILDSTSIILIMVPLVMSIVTTLGTPVVGPDVLIWFGIVTVIAVEIGLLTPPFGITVYVVRASLPDGMISLGEVFRGVFPFVVAMTLVTLLLTFFPALSLVLF